MGWSVRALAEAGVEQLVIAIAPEHAELCRTATSGIVGVRLTNDDHVESYPRFSADGERIMFTRRHLDSGVDWKAMAEPYRKKIAAFLDRTMLPGFETEIVTQRLLTPPDFESDYSSFKGAAFGLEPVLLQSAWFRPNNKSEDVKNLFLVGAGTHPGAGVPGVISSARVLDLVVPDARTFA